MRSVRIVGRCLYFNRKHENHRFVGVVVATVLFVYVFIGSRYSTDYGRHHPDDGCLCISVASFACRSSTTITTQLVERVIFALMVDY